MTRGKADAERTEHVSALNALAMDFEGLALGESNPRRYTDIRVAAQQLRFCAALVRQETYDLTVAAAWLHSGRLTLDRLEKAYR